MRYKYFFFCRLSLTCYSVVWDAMSVRTATSIGAAVQLPADT